MGRPFLDMYLPDTEHVSIDLARLSESERVTPPRRLVKPDFAIAASSQTWEQPHEHRRSPVVAAATPHDDSDASRLHVVPQHQLDRVRAQVGLIGEIGTSQSRM